MSQQKEDEKTLVFTEANPSGKGKIDLVVSLLRENMKEHKLIVTELKYARSENPGEKLKEAEEQIKNYSVNLETFSDKNEFTKLCMVFDAGAEDNKQLIYCEGSFRVNDHDSESETDEPMLGDIDHTSQSKTNRSEMDVCLSSMDISENESGLPPRTDLPSKKQPLSEVGSSGQELESSKITKQTEDLNLEEGEKRSYLRG